jgi:hypothetical protein
MGSNFHVYSKLQLHNSEYKATSLWADVKSMAEVSQSEANDACTGKKKNWHGNKIDEASV